MDAGTAQVYGAFIALLAALVGVVVADIFAMHREERASRAQTRREAEVLRRTRWEREIDDTRRDMAGTLTMGLARLAGDEHTARSTSVGPYVHPRANSSLIHEVAVLQRFIALTAEFGRRPSGSVSDDDYLRATALHVDLSRILAAQELRVEGGLEPILVDSLRLKDDPAIAKLFDDTLRPRTDP